jgi:hypothetical protein
VAHGDAAGAQVGSVDPHEPAWIEDAPWGARDPLSARGAAPPWVERARRRVAARPELKARRAEADVRQRLEEAGSAPPLDEPAVERWREAAARGVTLSLAALVEAARARRAEDRAGGEAKPAPPPAPEPGAAAVRAAHPERLRWSLRAGASPTWELLAEEDPRAGARAWVSARLGSVRAQVLASGTPEEAFWRAEARAPLPAGVTLLTRCAGPLSRENGAGVAQATLGATRALGGGLSLRLEREWGWSEGSTAREWGVQLRLER